MSTFRARSRRRKRKNQRETRRQFEPIDHHVTAAGKQLLDSLFRRRPMRHIREIGKWSFDETSPAEFTLDRRRVAGPRFN